MPPEWYGVPAFGHVTALPSPMSHTIRVACAVAVMARPGTTAVAELGPHVVGVTWVHSHTGTPTRPAWSAAMVVRIAGPVSCICSTARAASSPGVVSVAAGRLRRDGSHVQPPLVPGAFSGST